MDSGTVPPVDACDDGALLAAFESCAVPREEWTHLAHVRVAYLYLSQHSLPEATERMRRGLWALNAAHEVPDALDRGYHETITLAFLRLISSRIAQGGDCQSSMDFCDSHPDLLDKKVLLRFYSRERIMSAQAKQTFHEPDLAPLP